MFMLGFIYSVQKPALYLGGQAVVSYQPARPERTDSALVIYFVYTFNRPPAGGFPLLKISIVIIEQHICGLYSFRNKFGFIAAYRHKYSVGCR